MLLTATLFGILSSTAIVNGQGTAEQETPQTANRCAVADNLREARLFEEAASAYLAVLKKAAEKVGRSGDQVR